MTENNDKYRITDNEDGFEFTIINEYEYTYKFNIKKKGFLYWDDSLSSSGDYFKWTNISSIDHDKRCIKLYDHSKNMTELCGCSYIYDKAAEDIIKKIYDKLVELWTDNI